MVQVMVGHKIETRLDWLQIFPGDDKMLGHKSLMV